MGVLLEQFKNVLILILLTATIISLVLGHGVESIVFAIIVLFAIGLGFIQEYRAERAIEALRKMAAPVASVLRDGKEVNIPARDLVPGDIIILHTGDRVPADARLIESVNMQVEEAALTGESVPVEKHTLPHPADDLAVGDGKNTVYAGTAVTYGRGRGGMVGTLRSQVLFWLQVFSAPKRNPRLLHRHPTRRGADPPPLPSRLTRRVAAEARWARQPAPLPKLGISFDGWRSSRWRAADAQSLN